MLRRFLANLRKHLHAAEPRAGKAAASANGAGDVARLRGALDATSDAIFIVDVESLRFVDMNLAAIRMFGYSRDELLNMGPADLSKISPQRLRARYRALIAARDRIDTGAMRLLRKDGTSVPIEMSRRALESDGRWLVIGAARDVSEARRFAREMARCEQRYKTLFESNPLPMWVHDIDTLAFLTVNRAAVREYGYSREEFLGMTLRDIRPEQDLADPLPHAPPPDQGVGHARGGRHRTRTGRVIDVELTSHEVEFAGHKARLVQACNVTARLAAEAALRASNERFELISRATNDIIWDWDVPSDTRWWNENLCASLGYERSALQRSAACWQAIHPDDRERVVGGIQAALASGARTWNGEYRFRHSDGEYVDIYERAFVLRDDRGQPLRMIGAMMDITERKRATADRIHHLTHDAITGLPRFSLIEEHLQSAMAKAAAREGRIAVLYVDLDYFHAVNETRGRSIGDDVLRATAARLAAVAGAAGKVAHVAGDEFVLVHSDSGSESDAVEIAEAARTAVGRPMEIAEQQIYMTCSVGVSCFPDNATRAQDLLRQAEVAVKRAKREGRNAIRAFSNDQNEELRQRLMLGARLQSAIRQGELQLHYQPQISGLNWQVLGFEALLRWQDAELGMIAPKVFIQAAEELGLIVELGAFVLDAACRQARAWLDAGVAGFSIAVNISPLQLQRPDFVEGVRAVLAKFELPARCIELELTESVMMENVEQTIATMQALKEIGVRFALDDFGTGYSSLNYLRRFPIDCLKVDQSFVGDVTSDKGSAGICRAVIALGHQLGMQVLAEGVETAAQVAYLKRNDCDLFQGFYFSKPVAADKAFEILNHRYLGEDELAHDKQARTLLLVDDEANILSALSRTLRRDGYHILTASGADEAFDVLAREPVHVIVSDQRMPGMNGTELLSKVKDMHPETVRIVLSGYTDLGVVTEAINQGAIYKFLTKPWNDEELRRQIQDAFRTQKARELALEQYGLARKTAG